MRYSIEGEPLPVVICNLEQGEVMITESGAMSWMSPNMKMETTGGGIGKMFGRALSGESIFLNRYTAMNGADFSEERDLLCRSFPEVEPHFWNLMVILKNMNLHPDSRLLWTRDTLQP